jgi:uncharacterized protein (TIGR03663 family)
VSTGSSRSRRKAAARRRADADRQLPAAAPDATAASGTSLPDKQIAAPSATSRRVDDESSVSRSRSRRERDRAPDSWGDSDRTFIVLSLVILAVAAILRLFALSMNPFHHDEGINGWFVTNLVRQGEWDYDPANYHGPTLFYFGLAAEVVLGLTTEAMRLVTVVFGMGIVGLVLALRPFVGSVAALTGAALLAVSPGATYVARYFIHESLVAFFTLAIVVCALYLARTRQQRYLILAATSAAMLFATKETGILHVGVLAIALGVGVAYLRLRGRDAASQGAGSARRRKAGRQRAGAARGIDWRSLVTFEGALAAAVAFVAVYVVLFSSFFSNPDGLVDSLATFTIWTQTGTEAQVQPLQQYLLWMLQADAPILTLGFIGGLVVAWRAPGLTAVFIGLCALGTTAAYSLVAYKTPWIALNMLVPLAVVAGLGLDELRVVATRWAEPARVRAAGSILLAGALGASALQAYDINFINYDTEKYPYSYVHTTREALALVAETERIAAAHSAEGRPGIVFVVDRGEYWPLPWYYRDYPEAAFFGSIVTTEEEMIVARVDQEQQEAFRTVVDGRYERRDVYRLRPAVDLVLYVRNDIAATLGRAP